MTSTRENPSALLTGLSLLPQRSLWPAEPAEGSPTCSVSSLAPRRDGPPLGSLPAGLFPQIARVRRRSLASPPDRTVLLSKR